MTTILKLNAEEQSTYIVHAAFRDETGALVIPNAGLTWSLYDDKGNVINSRSAVAITSATHIDITLHGDDLAIGANGVKRKLTVIGTYDSTLGSNLELKSEATFEITPLVGV